MKFLESLVISKYAICIIESFSSSAKYESNHDTMRHLCEVLMQENCLPDHKYPRFFMRTDGQRNEQEKQIKGK